MSTVWQRKGKFDCLCGLLYFTDGKGIYPKKKPDYPTAFLFLDEYEEEKSTCMGYQNAIRT